MSHFGLKTERKQVFHPFYAPNLPSAEVAQHGHFLPAAQLCLGCAAACKAQRTGGLCTAGLRFLQLGAGGHQRRVHPGQRRRLLDYLQKKDIERYRAIIAKLGIRK